MFNPASLQAPTISIHVAICLWVRQVFLRAARLAPYECENIQNRCDIANVASGTVKTLFHSGMIVRQVFNSIAHTPQMVDFPQKVSKCRRQDQSLDL